MKVKKINVEELLHSIDTTHVEEIELKWDVVKLFRGILDNTSFEEIALPYLNIKYRKNDSQRS